MLLRSNYFAIRDYGQYGLQLNLKLYVQELRRQTDATDEHASQNFLNFSYNNSLIAAAHDDS